MGDERGKVNHGWSPETREKEEVSRLFKKKKKKRILVVHLSLLLAAEEPGAGRVEIIFPQTDYLLCLCV